MQDSAYKYFLWTLLLPILIACAVAFPAYLYYGAPVGGLTRIGFWPERDYLQTLKQVPVVLSKNSDSMSNIDVYVMGDSFSQGNVWQSIANKITGLTFQTYSYPTGKDCFVDWFKNLPSNDDLNQKQKIIIVETVERAFIWRMKNLARCQENTVYPIVSVANDEIWSVGTKSNYLNIDLMRQLQIVKNQIQFAMWPDRTLGGAARNVALTNPHLFSNHRSERLLYLDHDENRLTWSAADIQQAVANIKTLKLNLASRGYHLMLLVVPDKVHVYEDALVKPWPVHVGNDVAKNLREAGIDAPDLLGALKQATHAQQDVYLPNDTHTSEAGYRVIGHVVSKTLMSFARMR